MSKKPLYIGAALSLISLCWGEAVFAAGPLNCSKIRRECETRGCIAFTDSLQRGSKGEAESEALKVCNEAVAQNKEGCMKACREVLEGTHNNNCTFGFECDSKR